MPRELGKYRNGKKGKQGEKKKGKKKGASSQLQSRPPSNWAHWKVKEGELRKEKISKAAPVWEGNFHFWGGEEKSENGTVNPERVVGNP